jgi:hypothetical protein
MRHVTPDAKRKEVRAWSGLGHTADGQKGKRGKRKRPNPKATKPIQTL